MQKTVVVSCTDITPEPDLHFVRFAISARTAPSWSCLAFASVAPGTVAKPGDGSQLSPASSCRSSLWEVDSDTASDNDLEAALGEFEMESLHKSLQSPSHRCRQDTWASAKRYDVNYTTPQCLHDAGRLSSSDITQSRP